MSVVFLGSSRRGRNKSREPQNGSRKICCPALRFIPYEPRKKTFILDIINVSKNDPF